MCDCWSKPQCMKESARTRPVYNLTDSNCFLFFFGWFLLFCIVLFWFFRSSHLMHEHYRQWEQVVRHTDSRARLHGFKSRPWHLLEIITLVKLINLFKSPFPPLSNEVDNGIVAEYMSRWSKCTERPKLSKCLVF